MADKVRLGSGKFTYEVAEGWPKIPPGYEWREVADVAVDSKDRIYVFNRGGQHPLIVFDREGNFLRSWGEGVFSPRPHGLTLGPNDTMYCTDDGDHTVRQCTLDGKVLMTIGTAGKPSAMYGGSPFNRPTDVALDPKTGDLYVSDGYGNSRVHKFSPDGKLLFSWGAPGTDPGEFDLPHNIVTDKDGYVYVADRENHRVQVFDSKGKFETQWNNLHRPCGLGITPDQHVFIGELGFALEVDRYSPGIGPRITVMDTKGKRLARFGNGYGLEVGRFIAPHGISFDSNGNIYQAEVSWTNISHFEKPPDHPRALQKLVKVS